MLPKSQRFTTNQFKRAFQKSKKIRIGEFLFCLRPGRKFRCSIVVSKKTDKKAVVRNRLRRQLYALTAEAFREKNITGEIICIYQGESELKNSAEFLLACENVQKRLSK